MNFDRKVERRVLFLRSRLLALVALVRSWFVPAGARWGRFDYKEKPKQKERENGSSNR